MSPKMLICSVSESVQNVPVTYVRKMQLQLIPSRTWGSTDTVHKPTMQPAVSCAHPSIRTASPKMPWRRAGGKRTIFLQIIGWWSLRCPAADTLLKTLTVGREHLCTLTLSLLNKINHFCFCFKEIVTEGTIRCSSSTFCCFCKYVTFQYNKDCRF